VHRRGATREIAAIALGYLILTGVAQPAGAAAGATAPTVTVGVIVGATGPVSSIGIPVKNTIALLPRMVAGAQLRYVILDDGGDPGAAVKAMRQLSEQDRVDILIGSTSVPTCVAVGTVALETQTPEIGIAPFPTNAYTFFTPQPPELMLAGLIADMKAKGVMTLAYLGFSDSLGDQNYQATVKLATAAGIRVIADERYNRTDTTVTAQVLKIMSGHPDAVFVSAAGTPAALPQLELTRRDYRGHVYFLHGVINAEFLRVGGSALNGITASAGPFAVVDHLAGDNPVRSQALRFRDAYEAMYGAGSVGTFAAYAWDAGVLLAAALPAALTKASPGTVAFRMALRNALEQLHDVVGADGVYNMSASNHNGLDARARVLVTVRAGAFIPLQP
jgi:branched-chain amino acid transport system substrate-binding protein